MKVFLNKDIKVRVQEHATRMLRSGEQQRSIPMGDDPQATNGPAFHLSRHPDDLLVLGSFEFEGVKFYLGIRT